MNVLKYVSNKSCLRTFVAIFVFFTCGIVQCDGRRGGYGGSLSFEEARRQAFESSRAAVGAQFNHYADAFKVKINPTPQGQAKPVYFYGGHLEDKKEEQKKSRYPQFYELVRNMKLYKTTNTSFHAGHLYEHCMWTAQVVDEWFQNNSEWVEGIKDRMRPVLVLAAFLHDIGKAANARVNYKVGNEGYFDTTLPILEAYPYFNWIESHPNDGFEMVMPEADGDPNSPEDFFRTTPISYFDRSAGEVTTIDIENKLQSIKTFDMGLFLELKERVESFLKAYNPSKAIDVKHITRGLNLTEKECNQVRLAVLSLVQGFKGKIESTRLMQGPRIHLDKVFSELKLSEIERKFVAILIGIHWSFGVPVVSSYPANSALYTRDDAVRKRAQDAFEDFLHELGVLVVKADYNNGVVDHDLLRCAILIGAADVRGSSVVTNYNKFIDRYPWFKENKALFEEPGEHGQFTCVPKFDHFEFPTKGINARRAFLEYFREEYGLTGYKISEQDRRNIEQQRSNNRLAAQGR